MPIRKNELGEEQSERGKSERPVVADNAAEPGTGSARRTPLDETVPGGEYVVNGILVNAQGEPLH